jgi:hypothetical protein
MMIMMILLLLMLHRLMPTLSQIVTLSYYDALSDRVRLPVALDGFIHLRLAQRKYRRAKRG